MARLVVAALVLASCANPDAGAPTPTGAVGRSSAAPSGAAASGAAPSPRAGPAVVRGVKVLLTGLEIPWAVDLAPDGRLFITERTGRVRIARFDGATATLEPEPWATIAVGTSSGEGGLLGLALDPGFATNGYVYLYHSYVGSGGRIVNRLVRMRDAGGRGVDQTILLDGIPGSTIHDGGRIKVGPDGKLYVTTGDGAVPDRAQDTASLNGKILRLDTDGTVPPDSAFPNGAVSYGHRNPQGLAFQPDTAALYATEHGPSANDEVNRIERGGNYGWPTVVGQARDPRFIDPLVTSGASDTWAPSGATFLARPGPLRGSLVFAALRGQHLHRVVFAADGRAVLFEERLLQDAYGRLRDVFELPSGQLLVLTSNRDGRGRPTAEDDRLLLVTLG